MLLAGSVAAGGFAVMSRPPGIHAVVRFEGRDHNVVLRSHRPTVALALRAARITPVGGRLLAAQSHRAIAGHDFPAQFRVDGQSVTAQAEVKGTNPTVEVVNGTDVVEGTVAKEAVAVPPPPLPRIERYLWHRGTPGLASGVVGGVSGEVVSSTLITPPSAPQPVTDNEVALTLDDGPWPDTPLFLKVLQAKGVKATFCMIGNQVRNSPAIVKQVAAAGMTICNHTLSHNQRLDQAPPAVVDTEVQGGINALAGVLTNAPTLYRPPGGALNETIIDTAIRNGEQVIGWSVDPSDYRKPGTAAIVARVMAQVKPGAIVLMHDGGGDRSQTLAALPVIIDQLAARGYRFVTPDTVTPIPLGPPVGAAR